MIMSGLCRVLWDPELRYAPSGEPVLNLSLAYSHGQKKDGDEYRPSQRIQASLWGQRAEKLQPYLTKGMLIAVVLEDPRVETYQGRDGEGHKLVARVSSIEFADNRRSEPVHPQGPAETQAANERSSVAPTAAAPATTAHRGGSNLSIFKKPAPVAAPGPVRAAAPVATAQSALVLDDDDIPF